MLIVLATLAYVLTLSFVYGLIAIRVCASYLSPAPLAIVPLPIVHVMGLITLSVIISWCTLVTAVGPIVHVLLISGAVLWGLFHYELVASTMALYRLRMTRAPWPNLAILALMLGVVLVACAGQDHMYDDGLYHLQDVKWIVSFRVVPGVGNIHGRLAFNSAWTLLSAFFALPFLGIAGIRAVNGTLVLIVTGFGLKGVADILDKKVTTVSVIKATIPLVTLLFFYDQIGSLMTDLPAAVLTWLACLYFLSTADGEGPQLLANLLAMYIALYAITVKLSTLPIVLLILCMLIQVRSHATRSKIMWSLGLACFMLIPWIIRSVVLSGYVFYPVPYLNFVSVDWKMPIQRVVQEQEVVLGYGRSPGIHYADSLHVPLRVWVPPWFRAAGLKTQVMLGMSTVLTSVYVLLCVTWPKSWYGWFRRNYRCCSVLVTVIVGVVFWFITGPSPRFGYGFMYILWALLCAPAVQWIQARWRVPTRFLMIVAAVLSLTSVARPILMSAREAHSHGITPIPYPQVSPVVSRTNNMLVFSPKIGYQCWDLPLPCTSWDFDPKLQLRGATLQDGFHVPR